MPTYDLRCLACGHLFEGFAPIAARHDIRCPACGGPSEIRLTHVAVHLFKPFWHEHLDAKPVYIESKKQLKRECEKRGLISHAL